MDKSSGLGMPMSPQKISKKYKRQSLGMPRGTPSSSVKIRSPFKTLYFYCFVFYAFFLERLYFRFQFSFVLFAAINGWITSCLFWRDTHSVFIAKNTLVFTLIVQRVFSFSSTAFSFHFFALIFVQILLHLCIKVYLDHWSMLVFISKELFQKGLNGVGKEKKFHTYSGTNGSLFRLRLTLLHVILDVILIVCLVVFAVA
jgi:hypothetical protein